MWQSRNETLPIFSEYLHSLSGSIPGVLFNIYLQSHKSSIQESVSYEAAAPYNFNMKVHSRKTLQGKHEGSQAVIIIKYDSFDIELVKNNHIRHIQAANSYRSVANDKVEEDIHPLLGRFAHSIEVPVEYSQEFVSIQDLDNFYDTFSSFTEIPPSTPLVVQSIYFFEETTIASLKISKNYDLNCKLILRYASLADAINGTNAYDGEFSYRIEPPGSDPWWENVVVLFVLFLYRTEY